MSLEKYMEAHRDGLRALRALQAEGKDPYLPVLAELLPEYSRLSQVSLGIVQIELSQIAGTVTKGRTTAFTKGFLPLLDANTEFASKWSVLYDSVLEEGMTQPVSALEYYGQYYIVEGNKRVSVMRRLGAPFIEAEVTRLLPEPEDSLRYRLYQEFLSFYNDTKIAYIRFTHEGGYKRLCQLACHKIGERWESEAVFDLQSGYFRFAQAYEAAFPEKPPVPVGDALLIYLEIFGYAESVDKTPAEMGRDIARVKSEFAVAASGKPAALISDPQEGKPSLLSSVLHRRPAVVRCAFLYNSAPERSGWTYWHELGREAIGEAYGARVETTFQSDVAAEDAPAVMEKWIAEGYGVIFAASPVFLDACIRESALHPEVKILSCSLLASYHNVRSYYLRIYEAKFVLGAIAGAMAENGLLGYIADYPIYGTPASVNAFALGASITNPRARVLLDWSTLPGHDPEAALREKGVAVFSGRDISAPILESRAFGLYRREEDGRIANLAMPVWNWSRVYRGVLRSIITGAWTGEGEHNPDRAMNYYMGMSTGAIDLLCSERLPQGVRRLADLLHESIRTGRLAPFVGPLRDQDIALRAPAGETLCRQDIIGMDYLLDSVEGEFPAFDALSENARRLVRLQGLRGLPGGAR